MNTQIFMKKQLISKLALVGKGSYMPVLNKLIKIPANRSLPTQQKQVEQHKAATKYQQ